MLKCYKKNFYVISKVLRQFPPRKIAPNLNPNPNRNPNLGKIFLRGNCPDTDIKTYFYSIKVNLEFKQKYFYYKLFLHPIKIFFYYMNFSFDTFLVTISGLPFLFAKVRILLSVSKLNSSTMVGHRILEYYAMKVK